VPQGPGFYIVDLCNCPHCALPNKGTWLLGALFSFQSVCVCVCAWEGFALWVQTRSDIALTVRVHHHRKSVVLCEGRGWKMPDPTDKSASDRARILTEFGNIPRWDICVHLGQLNTVHGFEAIH